MLLRTITCLFPSIPNLFLCMLHSRYVNVRNFKPIEFIGWQQATLNFKDTLEDSCWSQQDCSLKCSANSIPELFMFFQLNLQVFRIVPSAPKLKGQLLHPSSSTSSIFMPDEDTKSCWLYLLLISCSMSTLLSQGHAISVMRQFLFCWSTHTMSRRLWSSFLSVYIQKSERNLKVLLSLTSQYYYYRYHYYYCCCWWCYYKHG